MLAAMQRQMAQALFDRTHESAALGLFKGDFAQSQRGLAHYRGNLSATWNSALTAAFPVLHALVGAEFFEALARAFGKQHPSTDGDLHQFGVHFADFLAAFAPVTSHPYFPAVARYEWALHRAHFADTAPTLHRDALACISPQQLEQMRVRLHPACTLLTSPWAVSAIWRAHQASAESLASALPQQLAVDDFAVTVRPHWRVDLLALSPAAFHALRSLAQGNNLGDAIDVALDIDADFALAAHLQQWMDHAILCVIEPPESA